MQTNFSFPKIIAHRGGGSKAPENTLAGFQYAAVNGFRAVEFDVMLTNDLLPVILHDTELGRTVSARGLVADWLAQDLIQCDAGSWFGAEFAHCRVPQYVDVLTFCINNNLHMNVEIKPTENTEQITAKIIADVTVQFFQQLNSEHCAKSPKLPFKARPLPLFSSFSVTALAEVARCAPDYPRALLVRHWTDAELQNGIRIARELQAVAIHMHHSQLTPECVTQIKQAGFTLRCYTVNEKERAQLLLDWGVDGIFTDNLSEITAKFFD